MFKIDALEIPIHFQSLDKKWSFYVKEKYNANTVQHQQSSQMLTIYSAQCGGHFAMPLK